MLVAISIPSLFSRLMRNSNKYAKCLLICCKYDLFSTDIYITNLDHIADEMGSSKIESYKSML